jgi:hypothetical protein
VDQPRYASGAGGLDHVQGTGNIAALEPFGIRGIDHPGDMDDRFGALAQAAERSLVIKVTANPFHPVTRGLIAAGQGAHRNSRPGSAVKQGLADKAGCPGNGNRHSTTI